MKKICLILCISLCGCEKIRYYPDKENDFVRPHFIAHRGGGNSGLPENSLQGCKHGLASLDGIEVDIQLSKDETVWLSHSADLPACGSLKSVCFPEAGDADIVAADSCMGPDYGFTRLEHVFMLMSSTYKTQKISLDVKAWFPCKSTSLGVTGILKLLAEKIYALTVKYDLKGRVMVESEVAVFLNHIKKQGDGIETYLVVLGDFERGMQLALKGKYSGLSFKYGFKEDVTARHVQMLRKKGLKIQLWTLNDEAEVMKTFLMQPDYIQTDNIAYVVANDSIFMK